ncbi:MAG TPA: thermonuclease family protein [Pyrinomonadaceae bacterium]
MLIVAVSSRNKNYSDTSAVTSASVLPLETQQQSFAGEPVSFDPSASATVAGKVVGVHDGDTITLLDEQKQQHKIRLGGIDAPELGQAFGEKSKQNLSGLIFGKTVKVLVGKRDKYNREVGTVFLDGKDINLQQVKDGLAWHYKQYQSEQPEADRKLYADAEQSAKTIKSGLWFDANPTPPWSYRNPTVSEKDKDKIYGNKNSMIYHWASCPGFVKISEANRVVFASTIEAEVAGYRAAKNCSTPAPRSETETGDEDDSELILAETTPPPVITAQTPVREIQTRTYQPSSPSTDYPSTVPTSSSHSSPTSREPSTVRSSREPERTNPAGASALCRDGTYSYSANRRGTCSSHGGVAQWLPDAPASSIESDDDNYSSPSYSSPSTSSPGGTVQVRGYFRKDGTYVRPHTRRAPRSRN